jgi:hypothetical protein
MKGEEAIFDLVGRRFAENGYNVTSMWAILRDASAAATTILRWCLSVISENWK